MISAVYDDGVGARDVYSVFDDGGRNQNVIFVVDEIEHYPLHLLLVQLAVADCEARLGHQTLHESRDCLDRLDAVVNKEDLSAARELEIDCRLDHDVGKLDHLGLDCESIAWRSF